jgi:hypothetical protein
MLGNAKSNRHRKTQEVEPDDTGRNIEHLTRGDLPGESLSRSQQRQAAAGAQNGGRDLETTFGRHAGIVSRLATSGAVMFFRLESLFDKSFHRILSIVIGVQQR